MAVRQKIDIEALLSWAYQAQCVDRMCAGFTPRGPSASPTGNLAQVLALGTRVSTSNAASRAIGAGNVADDALAVHHAVLALDDVFIEGHGVDQARLWTLAGAAEAGLSIQPRGKGIGRTWWLHGRDMQVQCRLDSVSVAALVIIHARSGDRPDWHEGWHPVRGRPALRGSKVADAVTVSRDRCVWRVWWWALELLAAQLADQLDRHDVTGPAAPAEPWLCDSVAVGSKIPRKCFDDKSLKV